MRVIELMERLKKANPLSEVFFGSGAEPQGVVQYVHHHKELKTMDGNCFIVLASSHEKTQSNTYLI